MVGRSVCHPAVEHAVWDADIRGSGMRIRERVRRMLAAVGGVERALAGYRWCWAADPLPVLADLRLIAAQLRPELFRALRRISDRGRHLRIIGRAAGGGPRSSSSARNVTRCGRLRDGMRITAVCHYLPPELNAPAVRTFEYGREWVRRGHQVIVITGSPNRSHGVICPRDRGAELRREEVDGIEVIRTWLCAGPIRRVPCAPSRGGDSGGEDRLHSERH